MKLNFYLAIDGVCFDGLGEQVLDIGFGYQLTNHLETLVRVAMLDGPIVNREVWQSRQAVGAHLICEGLQLPSEFGGDEIKRVLMNTGGIGLTFMECLWLVKDNSAQLSEARVFAPEFVPDGSVTYTPYARYADVTGRDRLVVFTLEELHDAIALFSRLYPLASAAALEARSLPGGIAFHRSRVIRSLFASQLARSSKDPSVKALAYCMAIECLVATRKSSGLKQAAAIRGAWLASHEGADRGLATQTLLHLYEYRSRFVHGNLLEPHQAVSLYSTVRESDELLRLGLRAALTNEKLAELYGDASGAALEAELNNLRN